MISFAMESRLKNKCDYPFLEVTLLTYPNVDLPEPSCIKANNDGCNLMYDDASCVNYTGSSLDCIGSSLDDIGSNLDCIGSTLDGIGSPLDDIGCPLDGIGGSLDDIGSPLDGIGNTLDDIGSNLDCIGSTLDGIGGNYGDLFGLNVKQESYYKHNNQRIN